MYEIVSRPQRSVFLSDILPADGTLVAKLVDTVGTHTDMSAGYQDHPPGLVQADHAH